MSRAARICLLASFCALLLPEVCGAVATNLSLSPPLNRSIELDESVDPEDFAEANGIEQGQVRTQSDGSNIIDFNVPDELWGKKQQELCGQPGVLACGDNHCRVFLNTDEVLAGQVRNLSGGPIAGAQIILTPKAPDIAQWVDDESSQQQKQTGSNNTAQIPGPRSCDFDQFDVTLGPITLSADANGNFNIDLFGGRAFDPGCWDINAGDACEVQSMPLRAIMPEKEPGKLLTLVSLPAGQSPEGMIRQLGDQYGLEVLEIIPMPAVDAALARYQIRDAQVNEDNLADQVRNDPRVRECQRDYRYRSSAAGAADPFAWMNYGADMIGAARMHASTAGEGITVAVIDTGIDASHPELSGRIVGQMDFSGYGTGPDRHGTAVAGIIAAESGNGIGAYGVSPKTRILSIKACEPISGSALEARCWSSTLARALNAALESDARVINLSLAGPEDPLISLLLDRASELGKLVVAAAGNDGRDAPPPFPASHPAVIAVTAVDARDRLYAEAVRGEFVDLAAPGIEVPAPSPGEDYPATVTGTSMATGYVSGSAALLMALDPEADPATIRARLESGALDLGASQRDVEFGAGRIDVCESARQPDPATPICPE